MGVIGLIAVEHHRALLPGQQVAGSIVAPEFHAAVGVKGGVLIKDMVLPPEKAEAVGVVEPARRRHQMELQPPGAPRAGGLFRRRRQLDEVLLQSVHDASPFPVPARRTAPADRGTGYPIRLGSLCPARGSLRSGWSERCSRQSW